MPTPDYFIALHCSVAGKNDELLGTDESDLCRVEFEVVDTELKKVIQSQTISVKSADDIAGSEINKAGQNSTKENEKTIKFKDVIEKIDAIIEENSSEGTKSVSFATYGSLHFRQCLHPQAVRKGIKLQKAYYEFYDVSQEYRKWSDNYESTLQEIAEDAGLDFLSLNKTGAIQLCTEIIKELVHNGHSFENPETIMDVLPPGMSTGYVKDETIVRVRGLPWQVSDHDVASFFKGLNITRGGVALCLNMKGRRNGEALVRFESTEHRDLAVKRHKHHLAGRYIEVYKGNAQDFIKIARGPVGAMNTTASFLGRGGDVLIRMRGLPYTASARNVVDFFGKDLPIQNGESGVLLVNYPDGTSTGDAFAVFSNENDAKAALKKHRDKIGQRYVELFRSTQAELQQVLTMYNVGYQFVSPVGLVSPLMPPLSPVPGTFPVGLMDRSGANQRAQSLMTMSCLRLRGLPFSASKDDIVTFLGQHSQGVIGTVHIIYNLQGRPSGESFLQLKSADVAHKAANELHLKHIGERYIEVFQCSVHDMSLMLSTSHANQMAAQHLNHANNNNNNNNSKINKNNNNNNNFIPTSTLPMQQRHRMLSPAGSNGMMHPIMPPVATIFNGHYPHLSPTVGPGAFFPAQPFPFVGQMVPPETVNYSMSPYCKPNGMALSFTYPSPVDVNRAYLEKDKDSVENRSVEVFIA